MGGTPLKVEFNTDLLGKGDSSLEYDVFDVFESTELGQFGPNDHISLHVNPMGVRMLRFNVKGNSSNKEISEVSCISWCFKRQFKNFVTNSYISNSVLFSFLFERSCASFKINFVFSPTF